MTTTDPETTPEPAPITPGRFYCRPHDNPVTFKGKGCAQCTRDLRRKPRRPRKPAPEPEWRG